MLSPIDQLSKHGHDLQFGTNVLGHFYLTQLLLPTLIASAKTSIDGSDKTRIVNVSSFGHFTAATPRNGGPIVYDTLVDGPKRRAAERSLYGQSKAVGLSSF
jgi:NAD(P)-dependent dehydrogenase (short-subunit alcohol dehydrogenase family)